MLFSSDYIFYSVSLPMLLMLDYWIMHGKHNPGSGLAEDFCFGSFPGCSSCVCTVARTAAFSCRTLLLSFSPPLLCIDSLLPLLSGCVNCMLVTPRGHSG